MAIIRWNPSNLVSFFEDDLELPTMLSRLGFGQGLNLYETDDAVIAEAALPGVPEENIEITYENNVVRISGSMAKEEEEKEKERYFMNTMSSSYNYSFRMPQGLVSDQEPIAEFENGILRLIFAKAEESKQAPKRIKVTPRAKREGA